MKKIIEFRQDVFDNLKKEKLNRSILAVSVFLALISLICLVRNLVILALGRWEIVDSTLLVAEVVFLLFLYYYEKKIIQIWGKWITIILEAVLILNLIMNTDMNTIWLVLMVMFWGFWLNETSVKQETQTFLAVIIALMVLAAIALLLFPKTSYGITRMAYDRLADVILIVLIALALKFGKHAAKFEEKRKRINGVLFWVATALFGMTSGIVMICDLKKRFARYRELFKMNYSGLSVFQTFRNAALPGKLALFLGTALVFALLLALFYVWNKKGKLTRESKFLLLFLIFLFAVSLVLSGVTTTVFILLAVVVVVWQNERINIVFAICGIAAMCITQSSIRALMHDYYTNTLCEQVYIDYSRDNKNGIITFKNLDLAGATYLFDLEIENYVPDEYQYVAVLSVTDTYHPVYEQIIVDDYLTRVGGNYHYTFEVVTDGEPIRIVLSGVESSDILINQFTYTQTSIQKSICLKDSNYDEFASILAQGLQSVPVYYVNESLYRDMGVDLTPLQNALGVDSAECVPVDELSNTEPGIVIMQNDIVNVSEMLEQYVVIGWSSEYTMLADNRLSDTLRDNDIDIWSDEQFVSAEYYKGVCSNRLPMGQYSARVENCDGEEIVFSYSNGSKIVERDITVDETVEFDSYDTRFVFDSSEGAVYIKLLKTYEKPDIDMQYDEQNRIIDLSTTNAATLPPNYSNLRVAVCTDPMSDLTDAEWTYFRKSAGGEYETQLIVDEEYEAGIMYYLQVFVTNDVTGEDECIDSLTFSLQFE